MDDPNFYALMARRRAMRMRPPQPGTGMPTLAAPSPGAPAPPTLSAPTLSAGPAMPPPQPTMAAPNPWLARRQQGNALGGFPELTPTMR